MCTSSVSNVIYHKFSHGPAFYTFNGKNVNVMLESSLFRCNRGNLVQFLLSPVYAKPDEYYCHVEQDPHQLLLQIEYTVNLYFQQQRSVLYAGNMSVYGNEDWQKTGRVFKR